MIRANDNEMNSVCPSVHTLVPQRYGPPGRHEERGIEADDDVVRELAAHLGSQAAHVLPEIRRILREESSSEQFVHNFSSCSRARASLRTAAGPVGSAAARRVGSSAGHRAITLINGLPQ